jgi:hypothetical protein
MKIFNKIEIVTGMIWAATILIVSIFSVTSEMQQYNWLVLTTAAGFQISFLSDALRKHRKQSQSKC